jgi:hypothetical protein
VEHCYAKLGLKDFGLYTGNEDKDNKTIDKLNNISLKLFGEYTEPVIKNIDYYPERLYLMKQIKASYGLNHNVEFYRLTSRFVVNKIKLFGNVRYDIREFEHPEVLVNYAKYEELGRNMVIKTILNSLR